MSDDSCGTTPTAARNAPPARSPAISRGIAAVLAMLLLAGGCGRPAFKYDSSPTKAPRSGASISPGAEFSLAVATFASASSSQPKWPQTGAAFSDALAQSLRQQQRVEIRSAGSLPNAERSAAIAAAQRLQPPVDYLVLGEVTDFHHTAEVAGGNLQRLGLFGRRNEAIVAISIEVVDLASGDTIRTDHLHGTASVPSDLSAAEIYRDLSPRSYLFWSTPLGRAGREALDGAVSAIASLPDPRGVRLEVIAQSGRREVTVAGGQRAGLAAGDRFSLLAPDGSSVRDPSSGTPITAVLLRIDRNRATAFLSGEPPPETPVVGMRLGREPIERQAAAGSSFRRD